MTWFSSALRHFELAYASAERRHSTNAQTLADAALLSLTAASATASASDSKAECKADPAPHLVLDAQTCLIAAVIASLTDGGRWLQAAGVWAERAQIHRELELGAASASASASSSSSSASTPGAEEETERSAKEAFFRLCLDYILDLSQRRDSIVLAPPLLLSSSSATDASTESTSASLLFSPSSSTSSSSASSISSAASSAPYRAPSAQWPHIPEYISSLLFLEQCAIFLVQSVGEGRVLPPLRAALLSRAEAVLRAEKRSGRRMNARGELHHSAPQDLLVLGTVDGGVLVSPPTSPHTAESSATSASPNAAIAASASEEQDASVQLDMVVENIRLLLGVSPNLERWDQIYTQTLTYAALARYRVHGMEDDLPSLIAAAAASAEVKQSASGIGSSSERFPAVSVSVAGQALDVSPAVLNALLQPVLVKIGEFDGASTNSWIVCFAPLTSAFRLCSPIDKDLMFENRDPNWVSEQLIPLGMSFVVLQHPASSHLM